MHNTTPPPSGFLPHSILLFFCALGEAHAKHTCAPQKTGKDFVPQLWYCSAQASGLSSREAGKTGKATHYQLAAAVQGALGGSALLKCSPVRLVNSGHPYLNAFLPPFHPIITGARNYCYEDKRAHNLSNSRSPAA